LLIGSRTSEGYPVTITRAPAGDAKSFCRLDPTDPGLEAALLHLESGAADEALLRKFGRHLFEAIFAGEIASVEPIEGLKEILFQLKSLGHKIGILTSNSSKNVMSFLEHNDLDLFDFIQTTSKIWSKNYGLKTLMKDNNFEISDVIYIGDETRDIEAAKKAGVRCAAVTWGYNSRMALEARNPDYLIHSPAELFQLIQ